ncbi:hypothetical protein TNCV_159191 [Trichonephila clavipes]|uniref:Uncharacterized protein n=1 Tax=Trichonephila clavipes TaxID=2585209 RepID=A0A8X6R9S3_TRICX|nr:hypothetical protein TNCV_159191 [Trichonephila clavipes]
MEENINQSYYTSDNSNKENSEVVVFPDEVDVFVKIEDEKVYVKIQRRHQDTHSPPPFIQVSNKYTEHTLHDLVYVKIQRRHQDTHSPPPFIQCDRSAPESEVLLARQNLTISETWMEDSIPVNVPGFDLRSSYNTAKRRQIVTTSSVEVSSSSRKAVGVAIYCNNYSFTDCNRVNIEISEINLEMTDAKAGDVCLVNVKANGIFKFISRVCVHLFLHSVSRN